MPAVVKQQQEEISHNHVPSLFAVSVVRLNSVDTNNLLFKEQPLSLHLQSALPQTTTSSILTNIDTAAKKLFHREREHNMEWTFSKVSLASYAAATSSAGVFVTAQGTCSMVRYVKTF